MTSEEIDFQLGEILHPRDSEEYLKALVLVFEFEISFVRIEAKGKLTLHIYINGELSINWDMFEDCMRRLNYALKTVPHKLSIVVDNLPKKFKNKTF